MAGLTDDERYQVRELLQAEIQRTQARRMARGPEHSLKLDTEPPVEVPSHHLDRLRRQKIDFLLAIREKLR